jgi:hypothetical protein
MVPPVLPVAMVPPVLLVAGLASPARRCTVAADAVMAVPRTIAAASAIVVLLDIFVSPG